MADPWEWRAEDIIPGLIEAITFLALFLFNAVKYMIIALLPMGVMPRKDVSGRVVLITGAGSGIGRLMALEFAKLRAKLVLVDINVDAAEETKRQTLKAGAPQVHTHKCNLADKKDIDRMMDSAPWAGTVDIVVNNAGIVSGGRICDVPDEKVQLTMDINIMAHFWLIKRCLPDMIKRRDGQVVMIASGAGLFGCADLVDYCSSKFAVIGMAESLMLESHAHQQGIAYTTICPYYINTGMFDGVTTRFPFLMPILDPDYAVARIMEGVLTEEPIVLMPRLLYILFVLKSLVKQSNIHILDRLLPVKCSLMLADVTGVSHSMDKFVGRNGKFKSKK